MSITRKNKKTNGISKTSKNKRMGTKSSKNRRMGTKSSKNQMMGGNPRVEKILVSFENQHTSPNIRSKIRVIKGPTDNNKGNGKIGYLVNFIASTANEFEEELSHIRKGLPKMINKKKKYEILFYDK